MPDKAASAGKGSNKNAPAGNVQGGRQEDLRCDGDDFVNGGAASLNSGNEGSERSADQERRGESGSSGNMDGFDKKVSPRTKKKAMDFIKAASNFSNISSLNPPLGKEVEEVIVEADDSKCGGGLSVEVEGGNGAERVTCTVISPKTQKARQSSRDSAHTFLERTYKQPTYCDVCGGLLVGLWSQGLQCTSCKMNVHRGEGVNGHDNCRLEALLTTCGGPVESIPEEKVSIGDAVEQLKTIAKAPEFFKDLREQANRDMMAHAKAAIVATGVEEEKSKNLRRFKECAVPVLKYMEVLEARGETYCVLLLLLVQFAIAAIASLCGVHISAFSLWPRYGFLTPTAIRLAATHNATVLATVHILLSLLSVGLRQVSYLFKRKSSIVDNFLREMFGVIAEEDLGVSVDCAAAHAKFWSRAATWSCGIMCGIVAVVWHAAQPQPPLEPEDTHLVAAGFTCTLAIVIGTYWLFAVRPPKNLNISIQLLQEHISSLATVAEEEMKSSLTNEKEMGSSSTEAPISSVPPPAPTA